MSRLNLMSSAPDDRLGKKLAKAVQTPGEQRDRITEGTFIPKNESDAMAQLEKAFMLSVQAEDVARKIKDAIKAKKLPRQKPATLLEEALAQGIITQEDYKLVERAEAERAEAIRVDSFTLEEYKQTAANPYPTIDVRKQRQDEQPVMN